ncbi:GID complex subunit 4, VID24 [Lobosporangium transversale]|uniref:Vacuolar import and degradation protein-domain-containing protein n=1 Tax=Lobosporangium transversale TaxID=64571 RepID=A0A1Y2GBW0_9FUNG|nr:vacuolar import and degradation protein-domain-containing protein [Lobosporangium transversale]KAF9897666.1 GID complex subunit 4, VID24 [Lobosporangium transversale]ORZ01858.1 vacuolar import and degradation protein-domain-containing protein [Lobosporangium transversale]|eukprot:XP_021876155.1 vacuolar import and degradation protein-domain-containing protein [Lobosporangium transversale]
MPVYREISQNTDTSPIPTEISIQWSCTCPLEGDGSIQDMNTIATTTTSTTSTTAAPTDIPPNASSSPSQQYSSTQSEGQQEEQHEQAQEEEREQGQPAKKHVLTCLLHSSNSPDLLKQQLAKKKRKLEIDQQLRKKKQYQPKRYDPFEPVRMLPSRTFDLYAGSQFRGIQRSGSNSYEVLVDIKHVDLEASFLCGYLRIEGLTDEYPELTTYFEAEIIGPKFSFITQKWDATELIDEEHWSLFKPFDCLASSVFYGVDMHSHEDDNNDEDDSNSVHCSHHHHYDPHTYDHQNESVVFMRWKEHFLVPDHRVRGISGASFAGFYYICYSKLTGEIDGYYYHQTSEKHQQLLLQHVDDRSFGLFEFR